MGLQTSEKPKRRRLVRDAEHAKAEKQARIQEKKQAKRDAYKAKTSAMTPDEVYKQEKSIKVMLQNVEGSPLNQKKKKDDAKLERKNFRARKQDVKDRIIEDRERRESKIPEQEEVLRQQEEIAQAHAVIKESENINLPHVDVAQQLQDSFDKGSDAVFRDEIPEQIGKNKSVDPVEESEIEIPEKYQGIAEDTKKEGIKDWLLKKFKWMPDKERARRSGLRPPKKWKKRKLLEKRENQKKWEEQGLPTSRAERIRLQKEKITEKLNVVDKQLQQIARSLGYSYSLEHPNSSTPLSEYREELEYLIEYEKSVGSDAMNEKDKLKLENLQKLDSLFKERKKLEYKY